MITVEPPLTDTTNSGHLATINPLGPRTTKVVNALRVLRGLVYLQKFSLQNDPDHTSSGGLH